NLFILFIPPKLYIENNFLLPSLFAFSLTYGFIIALLILIICDSNQM
ncbi:hypothetical protein Q604_UNBC09864G0001, partial [human gut metagenome]